MSSAGRRARPGFQCGRRWVRVVRTASSRGPRPGCAGQDEVHVVADVDGVTREGKAWFRVDRERRHLEWGSEGPDNYHGYLDITGDGATASVTVFLHTERAGSGDIDRGIAGTLAEIKRLAEAGPAPGPAS